MPAVESLGFNVKSLLDPRTGRCPTATALICTQWDLATQVVPREADGPMNIPRGVILLEERQACQPGRTMLVFCSIAHEACCAVPGLPRELHDRARQNLCHRFLA